MKKLEPLSRLVLHDVARKFQPDETLAGGVVLAESFNRMKLRLKVWRRMKFQPVEALAAGAALGESFNRMKLWLQVWGPMKFQPVETLAAGVGSDEVSTG